MEGGREAGGVRRPEGRGLAGESEGRQGSKMAATIPCHLQTNGCGALHRRPRPPAKKVRWTRPGRDARPGVIATVRAATIGGPVGRRARPSQRSPAGGRGFRRVPAVRGRGQGRRPPAGGRARSGPWRQRAAGLHAPRVAPAGAVGAVTGATERPLRHCEAERARRRERAAARAMPAAVRGGGGRGGGGFGGGGGGRRGGGGRAAAAVWWRPRRRPDDGGGGGGRGGRR
jgi:hypothetical protein